MKVYYAGSNENHRMYVQPGIEHPETSAWLSPDKKPIMFEVHFKKGVAEVDDNLGEYLIDKGLAVKSTSKIIQRVSNKLKEAILT